MNPAQQQRRIAELHQARVPQSFVRMLTRANVVPPVKS
jgi:hypothetical protein